MSPMDDYYTEEQVAELLGVTKNTMQQRRCNGHNHPPFIKVGNRILYSKKDVQKWLDGHKKRSIA